MLFASAFTKIMKICTLFLFDKPIKYFQLHFCLRSVFTFIFQGHMKVALTTTNEFVSRDDAVVRTSACLAPTCTGFDSKTWRDVWVECVGSLLFFFFFFSEDYL